MVSKGLAAGALVLSAATAFAQGGAPPPPPAPQAVIVSTGDATVRVTPDRAFITLATDVLAPTPSEAQQKNAAAATAVRERLKAVRLPDDSVKTVSYSLSEEYEFTSNKRVSRGFRAVNQIEIRVDDIAKVGEVVDAAVQAGAATVSNIRFDVKERAAAERQALKEAVADARARAEAMAAGAGVTLGPIVRIDEGSGGGYPVPRPQPMASARMMAAQADTPVSAGDIEIQAHVVLTAAIK